MRYAIELTFAALVASGTVLSAAEITGKVTLQGTPKEEITINMAPDPRCAALHTSPVTTRHYVVGADKGLANVLVYLKEGVEKKEYPIPAEKPLLDQEGCEYKPYVLGVRTGQTFQVRNSDPTLHNVHATPDKAIGNKEFNLAQPLKGKVDEVSFDKPEVAVRFKCDVHPWMFAYVAVLDHPFFAVTDKDGNFSIKDVPAGDYTIEAWHVKTHRSDAGVSQKVQVSADTKVNFTISIP